MVLQQQAEVTFRGKATPGKRVYASASWNHRKIYADCDRNGQWTLALPTPEAGGPYTITFSDGEEDNRSMVRSPISCPLILNDH